jgi:hypothetical protein
MTPPFVPSNRTIQPGLGNRERSDRAAGAQNPALEPRPVYSPQFVLSAEDARA